MSSQFENTPVYGRLSASVEHDGGVLCRLLELFASRGLAPLAVQYDVDRHAQPLLGRLRIDAAMGVHDWEILCARARQAVGVLQLEQDVCTLLEEEPAPEAKAA